MACRAMPSPSPLVATVVLAWGDIAESLSPLGDTPIDLQKSFRVSESEHQRLVVVPVSPLLPVSDLCTITGAETPRLAANTLAGTMVFWQRLPAHPCVLVENDRKAPGFCLVHAMVSSSMLVQAYESSLGPRVHVDIKYHGSVVEMCHQAVSSSWVISKMSTNIEH